MKKLLGTYILPAILTLVVLPGWSQTPTPPAGPAEPPPAGPETGHPDAEKTEETTLVSPSADDKKEKAKTVVPPAEVLKTESAKTVSSMLISACTQEIKRKLELIENKSDEKRFSAIEIDPNPVRIADNEVPDMASEGRRHRRRRKEVAKPPQKGVEIFIQGKAKDAKKEWSLTGKCLVSTKKVVFSTYELN